jgi:hypothetical protein
MTDPSLRERIARAICRVEMRGALSGVDLDRRVDEGWSYYCAHADKVLAIPELTALAKPIPFEGTVT